MDGFTRAHVALDVPIARRVANCTILVSLAQVPSPPWEFLLSFEKKLFRGSFGPFVSLFLSD